jgi:elongation factor G
MDFLKLERERGITISAAAITFDWRDARINLIDTPGHIDFTVEVERAVRVLDGAVAVFDGVAGVQAQSVTVWRQAARYGVPCIAFVNKMDREEAVLETTLAAMRDRLGARPLLMQVPYVKRSQLDAIVDVASLELMRWRDVAGTEMARVPLFAPRSSTELSVEATAELGGTATTPDIRALLSRVRDARVALLEAMADDADTALLDACFAELAATPDSGVERADARALLGGVRRLLLARSVPPLLPVLCGSALRNRGVQPLLDAVVDLLPAPHERFADAAAVGTRDAPLCALAFKVVHDRQVRQRCCLCR